MTTLFQDSNYPEAIASKPESNVEVKLDFSWGGKEKPAFEASVSGTVKDDKDYLRVRAGYNNGDDRTSVGVSAGRSSERDDARDDQHSSVDQR